MVYGLKIRCFVPTPRWVRGGIVVKKKSGGGVGLGGFRSLLGQTKKHQGIFFVSREDLILTAYPNSQILQLQSRDRTTILL